MELVADRPRDISDGVKDEKGHEDEETRTSGNQFRPFYLGKHSTSSANSAPLLQRGVRPLLKAEMDPSFWTADREVSRAQDFHRQNAGFCPDR